MLGRRSFAGRVVVVTGATGGLGRAICREFARQGALIGLLDRPGAPLTELFGELEGLGAWCAAAECDVTDEDACRAALGQITAALGDVDVLVNNAGITQRSRFADTDTAVLRKVMDVNLFGSVHCTRAALPGLRRGRGRIVVISSVAGLAPLAGRTGYSASKHALRGFFGSLGAELRGDGVTVTMVYPAFIDTGLDGRALDGAGKLASHRQATVGDVLTPDQAAAAIVRAAGRRERHLVLGRVGHLSRMINAHWPGLYERFMLRTQRSELKG